MYLTVCVMLQSAWSSDLKNNLQVFLSAALKSQGRPKLYNLFKRNSADIERERKLHDEQLKKMQTQLTRREQQSLQYQKRLSKIQVLFSVTTVGVTVWLLQPGQLEEN